MTTVNGTDVLVGSEVMQLQKDIREIGDVQHFVYLCEAGLEKLRNYVLEHGEYPNREDYYEMVTPDDMDTVYALVETYKKYKGE